jgi:hypothetical protein
MAAGWPAKVNYATGDVLSASNMNDIGGTLNLINPYTAGKNAVINGAMNVWQRGTSISLAASTAGYTSDRWQVIPGAGSASTISRQSTNDTTNLPFIQYCARVQRNAGQTGATQQAMYQSFESATSTQFVGRAITLSFYARAGANFSPTSGTLNAAIYSGTGTDQNIGVGGYTGSVTVASGASNLTTTWTRYTMTGTVGATATELSAYFYWTTVGTAGANDYVEITGVQLEIGSTATPFQTASGTIGGELALCQRYYEIANYSSSDQFHSGLFIQNSTNAWAMFPIVAKRVTPTVAYTGTLALLINGGSAVNVTGLANTRYGGASSVSNSFSVASGLTGGQSAQLYANGTAVSISFSSEL